MAAKDDYKADYEGLLENYRNAWLGLRMIREAVETLGPPGALLSQDGVLIKYGPEPIHEAQGHRGRINRPTCRAESRCRT
jgi:hypothetical protein